MTTPAQPPALVKPAPVFPDRAPTGVAAPITANDPNYGYFNVLNGIKHATFVLHSANFASENEHAALWLGVGGPNSWLQGGVEATYGDEKPYFYIEAGHAGKAIHFEKYPIEYGQPVTVTLVPHRFDHWSIIVNGKMFGSIPAKMTRSMMELYGAGSDAAGTINGLPVTGRRR